MVAIVINRGTLDGTEHVTFRVEYRPIGRRYWCCVAEWGAFLAGREYAMLYDLLQSIVRADEEWSLSYTTMGKQHRGEIIRAHRHTPDG